MTKKYGNWNNAAYYPNCNRIINMTSEYSTEKMLYGNRMEMQIINCYNNEELQIRSFEMSILIRVFASCGLTKGQLEKYLLMQGLNFCEETLEDCLHNMVKYGFLSRISLYSLREEMETELYDLAERGIKLLRESGFLYRNPVNDYYLSNDVFRCMRVKIVSNQLVLHILGSLKGLRTFYFNRELHLKESDLPKQRYLTPLYIQTNERNYIFEMVSNTAAGKKRFRERMECLIHLQDDFLEKTALVLVAETYEHLEMLTSYMRVYENGGFKMDVLYTHDSEWFYDLPGSFYVMVRAMGQSGLMSVKIL